MQLANATATRNEPIGAGRRPCGAPIDLVHLTRQSFGDASLEQEILRLFAAQTRFHVERLRTAASKMDRDMAIHTLLGSARGVGATLLAEALRGLRDGEGSVTDACREAERAADYAQSLVED